MTDVPLGILSRLWLREPDSKALEDCREIPSVALHAGDPAGMAAAYADLLLLNVYPYGTVFTDPSGELHGPTALQAALRYEDRGFRPPELFEVGAPDHVGLCLGFLDHVAARGGKDVEFSSFVLEWVPVACLAVEREPSAHPFYRAVAAATRERLMEEALLHHSEERASPCHSGEQSSPCHSEEQASPCHSEERNDEESVAPSKGPQIPRGACPERKVRSRGTQVPRSARDDDRGRRARDDVTAADESARDGRTAADESVRDGATAADEEEIGLSQVVRFLLAPARSGIFLSRAKLGHLARTAGIRLPFGSRFDVARLFFQTAGENGKVGAVLDLLEEELTVWETEYRRWAAEHPRWNAASTRWLRRTGETRRRLGEMRTILENSPELEYVNEPR